MFIDELENLPSQRPFLKKGHCGDAWPRSRPPTNSIPEKVGDA